MYEGLRRISPIVLLVFFFALGGRVDAQNIPAFSTWSSSALADAAQLKPKAACSALVSHTGYEFSVVTAVVVPANGGVPESCQVTGLIQPEIQFEVNLPAVWNGRLYMIGNGGYAGEQLSAPGRVAQTRAALTHGFATAQTNTGHDAAIEPLGTFAVNRQKFLDYAFRAVHVTALTAKRLAELHYGALPRRSYFNGCSTGGRQGLISAQRFPDDFDGIIVGAPVLSFTGTMMSYVQTQRALAASPLGPEKLKLLADAIYSKCDTADGLKDGVIDDPRRCAFKPSTDLPRCSAESGDACFTSSEITALDSIYSGVALKGAPVFPGWPVGAEIGIEKGTPTGWMPWFLASAPNRPVQALFGETFFRYIAFGRSDPSYEWLTFNIDADYEKLAAVRATLDATDPDLSRFHARDGKILSYFGWADPALNPMMGVEYYERVASKMGSATSDFYRLFMVPGMFHCTGGIGTSTFDPVTPLIQWVEKGSAPATISASKVVDGKPIRTRPLCPYPLVAKYKGSGSIDDAANFSCASLQEQGLGIRD
jgi:tannase/feruloyl esterase